MSKEQEWANSVVIVLRDYLSYIEDLEKRIEKLEHIISEPPN